MDYQTIQKEDFEEIYALVTTIFPKEECYPYDYHQENFNRDGFFGKKLVKDGKIITFVTGYQQQDYLFLDYFAVDKALRGHGIGQAFLKQVIEDANTFVILEVELPTDDLKQRRIHFYQRLGFHLNTYAYKMPKIAKDFGDTPLYIMSYPTTISENDFDPLKNNLYRQVYRVNL